VAEMAARKPSFVACGKLTLMTSQSGCAQGVHMPQTSPLRLAGPCALATVALASCAFGGEPSLDTVPKLLHNAKAHVLESIASIPPWVLKPCRDTDGQIAERGAEWNSTDVVRNPPLPWTRLQWAVTDGSIYVVRCEVGGMASHFQTVVAGPEINQIRAVEDSPFQDLNSPEKVNEFIRRVEPELAH
jgi:hypothetical protein